jgi:hypothetical protein
MCPAWSRTTTRPCERRRGIRTAGLVSTRGNGQHQHTTLAVELTAGDWKFTANGNVNVHYIYAEREDELLPAALALGASTTQKGFDRA